MTTTPEYEIISSVQNTLGEGPIWDTRDGRFYWVDAYGKRFYAASVPTAPSPAGPTTHHTGFFTIGVTPWGDTPGTFLLAGNNALYGWDADADGDASTGSAAAILGDPFSDLTAAPTIAGAPDLSAHAAPITAETHRFNDVIAGPAGEYYAGIMEWQPGQHGSRGTGALVMYTDRHTPHIVMSGVRLPNGMGFSPDLRWFYFTDSLARTIYRFPYAVDAPLRLGHPEPFISSGDRPGAPDGLTVATDGTILSARWGAASIDHYAPHGALIRSYNVPMRQPSSVCFGGPDGSTLLVTSATEGMDAGEVSGSGDAVEGITIGLSLGLRGPAERRVSASF